MKKTGILCILLSFICMVILNMPTIHEKSFSFPSHYGDKPVSLEASLWEVSDAEYAVLICPGYSCDRQKWRPFADLFVSNGYTTMSFDYSGQGASSGTIGFDNAKTDKIPMLIDDAIAELCQITGLDARHVILVGHSMGGRAILRLLDDYNNPAALTTVEKKEIGNAILLSPEVNYEFNAQASLFAGTSDAVEEPWLSYSEKSIAGTNLYLYGSTADDIVFEEDVLAIFEHAGGKDAPESGKWSAVQTTDAGSKLTIGITSGVLHSYEMYSPKFAAYVNDALQDISGRDSVYPAWKFHLVYVGWGLGLVGLFLTLADLNHDKTDLYERAKNADLDVGDVYERVITLEKPSLFLGFKMLMWIPGLIVAALICCLTVCAPFGSPVMNTPYMCCIAGYGLVMLWAYRKGRFKGTCGKLAAPHLGVKVQGKELAETIGIVILFCFYVWYVMHATMYRLIPWNYRIFWVLFATVIMTVGYYVSGCEADMLEQAKADRKVRLLYNLIQYVPLFGLVGFYLFLRSYSGLIGQVQNMVLMYIFCIPLGNYFRKRTGNRILGAMLTAFLFQTLMITSAALISMF